MAKEKFYLIETYINLCHYSDILKIGIHIA